MTQRVALPLRGSLIAGVSAVAMVLGGLTAMAQQPPAPAAPKPAAKPAAPKPAAQAPAAPKAAPQAQQPAPAAPPQQQAAGDLPPLVYSPWTKVCSTPGQNGQDANTPKFCLTGRDAHTETGMPVVGVTLIEPEGVAKRLRVTVPSPVQLQYGTRLIIDNNDPASGQYFTCFTNGCMSDYEGTPELIAKMKKGQTLSVQAINIQGNQITFPVPLADFAKVNDGPAMDPKVVEEQQKKLQEELQKKAEDARKKMEQQGGQPAPPTR
jgi:invasion protein IalB